MYKLALLPLGEDRRLLFSKGCILCGAGATIPQSPPSIRPAFNLSSNPLLRAVRAANSDCNSWALALRFQLLILLLCPEVEASPDVIGSIELTNHLRHRRRCPKDPRPDLDGPVFFCISNAVLRFVLRREGHLARHLDRPIRRFRFDLWMWLLL